jgi:hypothetical protein
MGKGAGSNTYAKILEAPLVFEGLKERCGDAQVAVQAEITATNWLIDDIDDAVKWPLDGAKGRQFLSSSMIFAEGFELVMKCCTEEGGQGIQMEIAFCRVKEEDVIGSEEAERW